MIAVPGACHLRRHFPGVIAGSDERATGDHVEAEAAGQIADLVEFFRRHKSLDRQMLRRWLQILAQREQVTTDRIEVIPEGEESFDSSLTKCVAIPRRLLGGSHAREIVDCDGVTGCVLGTAVGDALGLAYEGLSRQRAQRMFGEPDRYRLLFGRGMVSDDISPDGLSVALGIRTGSIQNRLTSTASKPNEVIRPMSKQPKKNQKREQEKKDKRRRKKEEKQERLERKEPQNANPLMQARLTPRGDYTFFEHPQNIFQIEFPADWKYVIEDEFRSVRFAPTGRKDVALSCYIMPYAIDAATLTQSPKLVEFCEKMFAQAKAVNPRRDATIPYFAMKADRNQKGLDGHYWMVSACDIFLSLTTVFPDGEQHLWQPVIERMLSTFRIPRETEALYNRAIMRLLGKMHKTEPEEKYKLKGHELRGENKTIPLGNLLARIRQLPGDWEAITDEFCESAVTVVSSGQLGAERLEDVRQQIYPFIRPDSLGAERGFLAKSEWLVNLNITYVINIPSGFRYITTFDLKRWDLELDELHELAMSNLSQLPMSAAKPDVPSGSLPFLMVASGDNMEASRLLDPRLYEHFAEMLGGPFIAAIPARDALILFPNNKEMRRSLQQTVRKDFESSAYPITDRLFLVTPDGTTLAEW